MSYPNLQLPPPPPFPWVGSEWTLQILTDLAGRPVARAQRSFDSVFTVPRFQQFHRRAMTTFLENPIPHPPSSKWLDLAGKQGLRLARFRQGNLRVIVHVKGALAEIVGAHEKTGKKNQDKHIQQAITLVKKTRHMQ